MSFASHDLPDDSLAQHMSPAPVSTASCPIHAVWPLSLLSRRHEPARARGLAARCARYGAWGTAAFLTLASLKCIVLYMILPALTVTAFTTASPNPAPKESSHDVQVPIQCPITSPRRGPGADPDRPDDAPLRPTQGLHATAAR